MPARETQLEHEQERHDAAVGLEEVAEVVVARDLAREDRVLGAHAVLDERMADAIDERHAACALDGLRHRPAGAHVVDDLAAGLLRQRSTSAKRAVAKSPGTNSPVSSTKKQRSASPSNATPKSAFSSSVFRMMNSRFSGSSGFGSWFGKLPSGSKKQVTASIGSRSSTGGSIAPAMPFAASITMRSGLIASTSTNDSTRSTNAGQTSASLTVATALDRAEVGERAVADVEQARVAADGERAAPDDLHPRVLLRVVRGGDGDAALQPELADRAVEHLRADHPDVDDVGARVGRTLDRGARHRRRGEAHVPADRDPPRLELLDVGTADRVRAFLVEVVGVDAPHVVRLENRGIQHRADAMPEAHGA